MAAELLTDDFASFPQRRDTMYMSTLKPVDASRTMTRSLKDPLRLDDIEGTICDFTVILNDEGCHPRKQRRELHKPPQQYDDLEKVKPRQLIPTTVNKPNDRILNTRDIEGSWPQQRTFHSGRCIDPLDPQYKLPYVEERPIVRN